MRCLLLCFMIVCAAQHCRAQSVQQIDAKLTKYMNRIGYWSSHSGLDGYSDSLENVNKALVRYIKRSFSKDSETLYASFPKAEKEGLEMIASDDHKIKFLFWNTEMGGTSYNCNNLAQFRTANELKVLLLNKSVSDYGCFYEAISTIHLSNKRTVYLVTYRCRFSGSDLMNGIVAYEISGGTLKESQIFKTSKKLFARIDYQYDFFESNNKSLTKDIPAIHCSDDLTKLYIPIVKGPFHNKVTDKNLVYVFDGEHFVFDKNAK